jgi:hypothetical protein
MNFEEEKNIPTHEMERLLKKFLQYMGPREEIPSKIF